MTIDAVSARAAPRAQSQSHLIPIAASTAVLVAGLFTVAQLRDAGTLREVTDVHLVQPIGYVLVAPLSDLLDALSLLSARQHIAALLGVLGLWALWRLAQPRRMGEGWRAALVSCSILLACITAAYASAALLPRPMAYLASADPDLMRIDFHSHTNFSRDANRTFSVESNRAWHRAGGYDAAYVTDHKALAEVQRSHVNALPGGGRDVILLQGIEADWRGEHIGLLGAERRIRDMMSTDLRDIDTRRFNASHFACDPILIWNHPRAEQLDKLPTARCGTTMGVSAIEIANGALHGMDLVRQKRAQIVALAREHNLALTSGTDNHGWGYVAPNWTLMRIRNWRAFDDNQLATRIESDIREGGLSATRVVERTTVDPGTSTAALALTVLAVPWRMLTTLSGEERLAWIAWIWAIAAAWPRRQPHGLAGTQQTSSYLQPD